MCIRICAKLDDTSAAPAMLSMPRLPFHTSFCHSKIHHRAFLPSPVVDRQAKGAGVCFDHTRGLCTRGDACKFSHDPLAVESFNRARAAGPPPPRGPPPPPGAPSERIPPRPASLGRCVRRRTVTTPVSPPCWGPSRILWVPPRVTTSALDRSRRCASFQSPCCVLRRLFDCTGSAGSTLRGVTWASLT